MQNAPSLDEIAELYRRMKVVRLLEEAIGRLHKEGRTRGPIHRCDGQEAVGIGATAMLEREDVVTSTHRGHAHYVGKGVNTGALMAEIMGRATGTCRGRGGHMLVADRDIGLLGGCGIVGGALPVAVGQALAFQVQKKPNVVVAFYGDGADLGLVPSYTAALWATSAFAAVMLLWCARAVRRGGPGAR